MLSPMQKPKSGSSDGKPPVRLPLTELLIFILINDMAIVFLTVSLLVNPVRGAPLPYLRSGCPHPCALVSASADATGMPY